jgi:DNA polymerase (family 10)
VSDHSVGLGIVQGVDGEKLRRQRVEIDAYNRHCAEQGIDFRLLQGSEVEILADGSLGLPDDVMAGLDVVVASIHSAQRQDRETITARCLKAIDNPHVDILGHPTGRLIGERPPTEIDMERILQACLETGTVVEINANPARLDVNDVYARRAVELGCKLAINCDAHSPQDLTLAEYGVGVARRGWLTATDVINTLPVDAMLALLKDAQKGKLTMNNRTRGHFIRRLRAALTVVLLALALSACGGDATPTPAVGAVVVESGVAPLTPSALRTGGDVDSCE